jgi:hypothetical protein
MLLNRPDQARCRTGHAAAQVSRRITRQEHLACRVDLTVEIRAYSMNDLCKFQSRLCIIVDNLPGWTLITIVLYMRLQIFFSIFFTVIREVDISEPGSLTWLDNQDCCQGKCLR